VGLGFNSRDLAYVPCAVAGLVIAVTVLLADLRRRKIAANRFLIAITAGTVAFSLFILTQGTGLGDFGALAGWFGALALRARRARVARSELLDAGSPAVAASIAAMKLTLYLTVTSAVGSGLQGSLQRMLLYEFLMWAAIGGLLWSMGARASLGPRPKGEIFAILLMMVAVTGFIRQYVLLNSGRFAPFAQMSREQFACIGTFVVGGIFLGVILSRYHEVSKEHRILKHVAERGDVMQQEYSRATPECPHPERWRMYDAMAAEVEVLDFLKTLVTTIKPEVVVETGTFLGASTLRIAEGLKENGIGRVITCEADPKVFEEAKKRFLASDLADWIQLRNESSLEMKIEGRIDLLYCDSDLPLREQEVRRFLPQMNPNGLILMHDASSALKTVREGAQKLEREGLLSVVFFPTPRGLVVAQKREGRT
jgi:predicted O-methyltransferase YrrM